MQIEVGEIGKGFGSPAGRQFPRANEASEALGHFNICEVRAMELVPSPKKARFDPRAERRLQQKFEEGRRVDDDHCASRSARMTTAAGVFNVTRFRPWILANISSRVGRAARRSSSPSR